MHRVLYLLPVLALFLTACSSGYRNPNFPDGFPSSPSIIVEENGWKSFTILPQRDGDGKEITFGNYKQEPSQFWDFTGLTVVPMIGTSDLVFLTDHRILNGINSRGNNQYTWLYKTDALGNVNKSERLPSHIDWSKGDSRLWGFKDDPSIYRLADKSLLKDEKLISTYGGLNDSIYTSLSIGGDKSLLVEGRYYLDWLTQQWSDVRPLGVYESEYFIASIKDQSSFYGWSVQSLQEEKGNVTEFRLVHQELNKQNSQLIETFTSSIKPKSEMFLYNSKLFINADETYLITNNKAYTSMSLYKADSNSGSLEAIVEDVPIPSDGNFSSQGSFTLTDSGKIFYTLFDCGFPKCKTLSSTSLTAIGSLLI